mgnify:CR=1 FL=1
MTTREAVFPFGRQALYERNRYSAAIKSNGFLFVSGQVGSREDGSPEQDLKEQIRLAFDNLNAVCYQRCKTDPPQRLKIDPGVNLLL